MFIQSHVPSQVSEGSCIFVLEVSIFPFSTILIFNFGIVLTVWYFFFLIWSPHNYTCVYNGVDRRKYEYSLLNVRMCKCYVMVVKMKNYTHTVLNYPMHTFSIGKEICFVAICRIFEHNEIKNFKWNNSGTTSRTIRNVHW